MKPTRLVLAVLALLVVAGGSALADPGDCRLIRGAATPDPADDVEVCRQDVWFHQAETKVGNLGATGETGFPSWNTTKPAASYQSGAGGGYIATNASATTGDDDGSDRGVFEGTFTGNIDNIAATVYLFVPGRQGAGGTHAMHLQLEVDGQLLYESSAAERVNTGPDGDVVYRVDFAFVDAFSALEQNGIAVGPGVQHQIRVGLRPWFTVNDTGVYVYDAAEVPSGLVFNLEQTKLGSYTKIDVTP
ncbi:MAG: hypothetical protein ACRDHM_11720 [Actinomycetota bacterium]